MPVRLYPPNGAGSIDVDNKDLEAKLKAEGWSHNAPLVPEPEPAQPTKGGKQKQ